MEKRPHSQVPDENTRLIDLNFKSFEELFDKVLSKRISEISALKTASETQPEKKAQYLSRKETAAYLKITLPTLNSHTKSGKLTAYLIGRRVLYRADDLEQALRQKSKYIRK